MKSISAKKQTLFASPSLIVLTLLANTQVANAQFAIESGQTYNWETISVDPRVNGQLANISVQSSSTNPATIVFTGDTILEATSGATQVLHVNGNGASLDITAGTLTIKGNNIDFYGSGIEVGNSGIFEQSGNGSIAFENNTARFGGAISNYDGTVSIGSNATFTNNTATGGGGALFNINGPMSIGSNATFTNNTAIGGGAIVNSGGTVSISSNATFTNNTASNTGGAIDNISSSTMNIGSNATFTNNTTSSNGSAIFNYKSTMNIGSNAVFTNNTATGSGGAIDNNTSTMSIGSNAVFTNNTASDGGAISNYKSTMSIGSNAVFTNNTASNKGGAIDNNGATFTLDSGTFGDTTLFSGNQDSSGANSIYMEGNGATLTISGAGTIDMRDPMRGAGTIQKTGNSIWKLGGNNSFDASGSSSTGFTLSAGTLYLYRAGEVDNGRNGAVQTGSITLAGSSSSFTLGDGAIVETGGTGHQISTAGSIVLNSGTILGAQGNTDLTLTAAQGVTIAQNKTLTLTATDTADQLTLNGNIGGTGGLIKNGGGTAILTGQSTWTGNTTVAQGTLMIGAAGAASRASINSAVSVENGATLAGYGIINNNVSIDSGAFLSPGDSNSIGTLSINGDLHFSAGSTLIYNIENALSDLVDVGGTVNIQGGTVEVRAGAGAWDPNRTYVVINTQNGVIGRFDTPTADFAFLDPELIYTDSQVLLGLTRKSGGNIFSNIGQTSNQRQTGYGISTLADNNPVMHAVIAMSADQARAAYDNLSGEGYGSTRTALLTNSRYLRDAINRRMMSGNRLSTSEPVWLSWKYDGRMAVAGNAAHMNSSGRGIMSGLDGEANENILTSLLSGYEHADIAIDSNRQTQSDVDMFHAGAYTATEISSNRLPTSEPVWLASWGHDGRMAGDGNAVSMKNSGWGVILGLDGTVKENIFAGLLLGYERADIAIDSNRQTQSDVDMFHTGAYAATEISSVKLRGGMTWSHLGASTERLIWVDSLQGKASADYGGYQLQFFAEASKDMRLSDLFILSPYVNLANVWLHMDDARESGTPAALDIRGGTDRVFLTTLGLRGIYRLPAAAMPFLLYADLGWGHASGDINGRTSNSFLPVGGFFSIRGVGMGENVALIATGFESRVTKSDSITLGYAGQFGDGLNDHSVNLQWKKRF